MIEKTNADANIAHAWRKLLLKSLAVALAVALAGLRGSTISLAVAAEVDAVGIPAPTSFADIVARIKPAVVRVRVKIEEAPLSDDVQADNPASSSGSPLDRLFRRFGIPFSDNPAPRRGVVLGSGFFISADGYVVTNNHVVNNGLSVEVTTDSGQSYQAKIIGTDPQTDLALIKVVGGSDFPYVRLSADVPRIGDWIIAVGNPFGLGGTVTAGIVSARGRDIGAGPYDDFIQIDAPVNPGNSGGPTFNVRGEVIGVNTAILSPSGGFVGVAFDIPVDTVQLVVQQLKDTGHVTRGWIGVATQPVTPAIADAIGLNNPEGALIDQVEPGSPAAKGGIEAGDVIISVNGEAIRDPRDLAKKIATIAPGASTTIATFRNGAEKAFTVILGELPQTPIKANAEEQTTPSEPAVLGLSIASARAVRGAGDHGVVITDINPAGRAAESGLQVGDVIMDIGGHAVDTPAEARVIVDQAHNQSKRAILLHVKRGEVMTYVAVPIA